jgi:hypothetical protein
MSHPTRAQALAIFFDREASPREIAADIDEPVNNVTYHINQLVELGWIELVAQRPARGGRVVEHFYRATGRPEFSTEEWARLGPKERLAFDATTIDLMSRDVTEAMLSGTFFADKDNHLTRTPLEVDAEGWEETKQILDHAFNELLAVKERVANRVAKTGEGTFPTKVEIIHFKSPTPKEGGGGAG